MQLNIVGGSYKDEFVQMNPQRTINWFIHKTQQEADKYKSTLKPTPGLTTWVDTAGTNLRGGILAKTPSINRCFLVADQVLYELTSAQVLISRGTLTDITNDSTPVWFVTNSNGNIMIGHSSASYNYNMNTDTLTKITDADYPGSITSLDYGAGYGIVASNGRVYYCDLLDFTSWNGSAVFTPEAEGDPCISAKFYKDNIYCFGQETIETYVNDGAPFTKLGRDTINVGLANTETLCKFHEGFIFLGKSKWGQFGVYFYNGSQVQQISTDSINWQLNNGMALDLITWENDTQNWEADNTNWEVGATAPIEASYAFIQYSKDGHIFYYLTVPNLDTTFVYDITTQEWTERQSYNGNAQQEFRGRHYINFDGLNLFLDSLSGKVYAEDYNSVLEDGNTITRTRDSQIFSSENKFISIYSLEIDCNTGAGLYADASTSANLGLQYSKDGGKTFSTLQNIDIGNSSDYTKRAIIHKLGTARNWVFRLVLTDASKLFIQEAIAHGVIASY